jgi:hypothetical protein
MSSAGQPTAISRECEVYSGKCGSDPRVRAVGGPEITLSEQQQSREVTGRIALLGWEVMR